MAWCLLLEYLFLIPVLSPGPTFSPVCGRSFSFSHSIYFYCLFPSVPPFHWPRVTVYLNHLPAFIFRFSSLPLLGGSLATIILALHISFPPFLCRVDSEGTLIKTTTFSTAISSRHRPQGLVPLLARPSLGAAAGAPREGRGNMLRDRGRLRCPRDMAVPLDGPFCPFESLWLGLWWKAVGQGVGALSRGLFFQLSPPAFRPVKAAAVWRRGRALCEMP